MYPTPDPEHLGYGFPDPDAPLPRSARHPRRGMSPGRKRIVTTLAVLTFLAVPAIAGYQVGKDNNGSPVATAPLGTDGTVAPTPSDGSSTLPGTGSSGSTSSGGSSSSASVDATALAASLDNVVVNINTTVEGGGQAAGTGIVISSSGLVITNNHVIAGSTSMTVELASTGQTHPAKVLGYSVVDDVALIQVQGVSGLTPAHLGSSGSLSVGQSVVALGNAGGRGGTPTVVTGRVTALEQEITASDSDGSNAQTIDGLIQLAANIQPGDSGGPVVDSGGTVVGMTVAASVSNGFGFPGSSGGEGYAIAIEDAVAVVKRITSGEGGPDIRVGATRGVLGVQIQPQLTNQRVPGGSTGSTGSGAKVVGVESGSGAEKAGLTEGSYIIGIGSKTIATTSDLTSSLVPYAPGDTVELTWKDASGTTQHGTVKLGEGPPA